MERPKKGDWLAVLDSRGRVAGAIEVVKVRGDEVEGFELFPDDGRPVAEHAGRCLEFARPGEARAK